MNNLVNRIQTNISEAQMAQAIIEAWTEMFGSAPYKEQVSMILAQNNLETGHRKSMWNYNVGNIKHFNGDSFDYFAVPADEYINGSKKIINSKFRAYPDLNTGVKDYLKLLSGSHYADAWQHILHPDPVAFSKALKAGGYYTADESSYTSGIKSLFDQANKTNSYEDAIAGRIPSPTNAPQKGDSIFKRYLALLQENGNNQSNLTQPSQPSGSVNSILDKYLKLISAAPNKQLYKKLLPNNDIIIKINSNNFINSVEFSRILCAALDEELFAEAFTHTDGNEVEVNCSISGPSKECFGAVKQLTEAISDLFYISTSKIGGIKVKANVIANKKSSHKEIGLKTAQANYRKFLLKFI